MTHTNDKPPTTAGNTSPLQSPELGLTFAGQTWLAQPAKLPLDPLGFSDLILAIARPFSLSTREALLALCAQLSLAIGPSFSVRDPFGRDLPLSLQILSKGNSAANLDVAINTLGQRVLDTFTSLIGRRRETAKSLTPEESEIVNGRKKRIFPMGEVLSFRLAAELIKEDGDCAFGSLSDSTALKAFLNTPEKYESELDQFLKAGWHGDVVPGIDEHPIYPVVSLIWSASSETVNDGISAGLLDRLPGLLIASPMGLDAGSLVPSPLPAGTIERLNAITIPILSQWRLYNLPKHSVAQAHQKHFDDEAEVLVAASASFVTRYSAGEGIAGRILRHAPTQISKLAALLSMVPEPGAEINKLHVGYAMELYRWLVRGTLQAVEDGINLKPDSFFQNTERVRTKLSLLGAMTLRQLAAESPRQDVGKVQDVLRHLMENEAVSVGGDGKFSWGGSPAQLSESQTPATV